MRDFTVKVLDGGGGAPLVFAAAFAGKDRAKRFAESRVRDVPAIMAIEIWEGDSRLTRVERRRMSDRDL